MAELHFFTGTMDSGKSTLALQTNHNHSVRGRGGRIFTTRDRAGSGTVSSRLGLRAQAIEVDADFDFWAHAVSSLTRGARIDYLICDEAQFYTRAQVDDLAKIVDELQIDVFAFGILTDFRTQLFEGSARLVELADRMNVLQVEALCWCGKRATHNARTEDGIMVTEGEVIVVGDVEDQAGPPAEVAYEVLCRQHHRRRMTAARAHAVSLAAEPLPFDLGVGWDTPAVLAKFPGRCQQCLEAIAPGDSILVLGAKGPWVHEACHAAAGELVLDGVVPRPASAAPARKARPDKDAMTPPPGAIEVFTDGACRGNPGPGGWAWASDETTYASGHEAASTNQRMEVRAAWEALKAHPGPLVVVSDSTYVVNCFRDEWWKGWLRRGWTSSTKKPVANRDLWEPFVELFAERDDVAFRWVKGHSGNPMNELVDRLAVAASHAPG